MSEHERPATGGSYVREKDGSLRLVDATAPAPLPAAEPAKPGNEPARPVRKTGKE